MSTRKWHYIKGNAVTEIPSAGIWFDTETDQIPVEGGGVKHVLRFGWLCYQRSRAKGQWCKPKWYRFTTPREFWVIVYSLLRTKAVTYMFCHNTNFDLPVLDTFRIPATGGWKMKRAVIDAPPTILHFTRDKQKFVILDTLNFWRVSLADLGKSVGYAKLTMPKDSDTSEDWDTYCKADVEVIRKAVQDWWVLLLENDLGGFASTLAGQSMRIWRHKYMTTKVLIDCDPDALELARNSYCGGRNECFRHGRIEGPVYYVDINSMYPSVMHGRKFPSRLLGVDTKIPAATFAKYHRTHATIGRVQLCTEEAVYPSIVDGRLCFPVGEFWADLAGPELEYAVIHGHILEWDRVAVYHADELFTGFVAAMYKRRLEARDAGNDTLAYFYKILLNSLYGKYGQRGMVWEETAIDPDLKFEAFIEYDVATGVTSQVRRFGGIEQRKSKESESRDSHPAIASYVTSYARMELWKIIKIAGLENVYYCDTDGIMMNAAGYKRIEHLVHPSKMGLLKVECIADYMVIRGLKDYDLGGKSKTKGVRKSAVWLSEDQIRQEQWSGLAGLLSKGTMNAPTTKPVIKNLSRTYRKGTFNPDGTVTPLRLNQPVRLPDCAAFCASV